MRPGAAQIWFTELDRLEKLYKARCNKCQEILARLSKIKIPAKKEAKDKALAKERNGLLEQLREHRVTDCKQVCFRFYCPLVGSHFRLPFAPAKTRHRIQGVDPSNGNHRHATSLLSNPGRVHHHPCGVQSWSISERMCLSRRQNLCW